MRVYPPVSAGCDRWALLKGRRESRACRGATVRRSKGVEGSPELVEGRPLGVVKG